MNTRYFVGPTIIAAVALLFLAACGSGSAPEQTSAPTERAARVSPPASEDTPPPPTPSPDTPAVQGDLHPAAPDPTAAPAPDTPVAGNSAPEPVRSADPAFVDSWRVYSEYLYYDAGGSGGSDTSSSGTTRLELNADGSWQFGSSSGSWTIQAISASDWDRWAVSAYGPERKIVLQGWNGGVEDGPIEESAGYVDFVWVIYHVDSPDPGLVYIKFGH